MGKLRAHPPLIPADIDLRDYRYTPIFRARLFGSNFHATVSDSGWRAGVTLWLKSWDQVPAGTLPPGDVELCRLAELGRDLPAWEAVKAEAMHGWRVCSDGRMHHEVVAAGVLEAWENRRKAVKKGRAGAAARWHKHDGEDSASNATAIARAMPAPVPNDGNRMEGNGIEETPSLRSGVAQPEAKKKTRRQIPEGFPFEADQAWAQTLWHEKGRADLCTIMADEMAKFRDHHSNKLTAGADWPACWRTWARNAIKFSNGAHNGRSNGTARQSTAHDNLLIGGGLALEELRRRRNSGGHA